MHTKAASAEVPHLPHFVDDVVAVSEATCANGNPNAHAGRQPMSRAGLMDRAGCRPEPDAQEWRLQSGPLHMRWPSRL